ncbi:peptidase S41 [Rhizobium sp. AC27/96]|uniref:S41 family peptidase n=1 Tax=Rhizobium sp. AC27/96 TaxID=1841653 RepID=UPI0008289FFD|nr:S41 family peptidase [Rhizobium sp. AC27/96]OCJ08560.1 peptidase S41 [Rhizobium sp. AC27/96]
MVENTDAGRPRDPDVTDRAHIASTAYHVIKRYFAHAEGLPAGYDFEARYRAYLGEAIGAENRNAFSLATMRFFASLQNGHTFFEDEALSQQAGPAPFGIKRIDGQWTIVRSRMPELAPGEVVTMVDHKPVDEWLKPIHEHIGQSSRTALDRATWRRVFLFPRHFTIGMDDGRQVPVDLNAPLAGPERGLVTATDVETIRRADGLVVIRIPSFANPRYEQDAIFAIHHAGDARAILLDLRDNGGGSTPGNLLSAIMTKPYRGTLVATPMTIAMNDASNSFNDTIAALPTLMMRYGPNVTPPLVGAWQGNIALLVNDGCASACEDFVLRFQDGGRGLVLGEPTYGSTGQPYFVRFPEFGMSFRVSTKREYFPDGRQFEGVGITPDRPIPVTREELSSGIDSQLELAASLVLAQ